MGEKHEKQKIIDRWGKDLNTKAALYQHIKFEWFKSGTFTIPSPEECGLSGTPIQYQDNANGTAALEGSVFNS